jgi:phosphoenolpyruvate synthase/pyruvate phosphate dikinase
MANGTAVNICTMVFGNRGDDSGTGENVLYGEYLVNDQGEDVVAGIRIPKPLVSLKADMPEMAKQLDALRDRLESHYKDVEDFEFTIERGILYCLQTRNGKMNPVVQVRTSVEMVKDGILTSRGGKTSHAAVVARGMGKCCVAGAEGIHVDVDKRIAIVGDTSFKEGDMITLDGTSGQVYLGEIPTVEPEFTDELVTLLSWADEVARIKVMANSDTPVDAKRALKYGAVGIGLARTERMFNDPARLPIVIDMIVADSQEERQEALDRLLPLQQQDFKSLFEVMAPYPDLTQAAFSFSREDAENKFLCRSTPSPWSCRTTPSKCWTRRAWAS